MNKQKPVGLVKKVGLGLLAVGLVVAVAYFAVVRPLQIRHQKQQFARAEAGLDQLYNQIVAKVGKPDQYKKERSCSRAHLKSERGPLECSVGIYLLYEHKNLDTANELMKQVSSLGSSQLRVGSGAARGNTFVLASSQPGIQTFLQDIDSRIGQGCSFGYSYPKADPGLSFATNAAEVFEVGIICGGPVMAEFYPVKN